MRYSGLLVLLVFSAVTVAAEPLTVPLPAPLPAWMTGAWEIKNGERWEAMLGSFTIADADE